MALVTQPPPESYEFDNLIVDISQKISVIELEVLKKRFTVIKHVETSEEMLTFFKNKGFIGKNNIMYIQQIVRVLERKDLVEVLERYIAMFEEDTVLHFVKKSKEIVEGYKIVEFHILGPLDTNKLEHQRREFSRLLLCPLHEIIVKGIQETQSTLLSLMFPTMYVDFLTEQLEKHSQRIIKAIMHLEIDYVMFEDKKYLLQNEGDIYKVKKSTNKHGHDKHVDTVGKSDEENQQMPKHFFPMNNFQNYGPGRSGPENDIRQKKSRPENGFGTKRSHPESENRKRILRRSNSVPTKISKLSFALVK